MPARLVARERAPRAPRTRQAATAAYPVALPTKVVRAPTAQRSNPDLWRWYLTPEVWSVANRVASGVRRVAFYPAVNLGDGIPGDRCPPLVNPDGTTAEGIDARLAADAQAVWERVRSPLGSQSDLFATLAVCLMVAGDGWQFGYPAADDLSYDPDGEPAWVGLARSAITERAGLYEVDVGAEAKVRVPPATQGQPGGRAIRVWEPDPRAPAQAVSWVSAARDPLNHLTMIYEAIAACALSRLNAGVILAPDDQDPAPTAGAALNTEGARRTLGDPLYSKLVEEFAEHVEASATELDGFARAVPAAIGMDSTLIEHVRWLELAHNLDPELGKRIDDLRHRVLIDAPLPPEVTEGMASLSGLGGGNVANRIGEDEYQMSTVPTCERICAANTDHVLRAALVEMGHDPRAVLAVRVGYSADALLQKPDRSEAAIQLASLPVPMLTDDEVRDAAGLSEYEGPDEETQLRMLAERLVMAQPAYAHLLPYLGLPPVPEAVAPGAPASPIEAESVEAATALPAARAAAADRGGPPGDTALGEGLVEVATRYEEAVTALFAGVVARMLERAGSRVASLSKRREWGEVRERVASAPPEWRGAVPGVRARLAAAEVDDNDLFGGALAAFASPFDDLTARAQRRAVRLTGADWDHFDADAEVARAAAWALGSTLLIAQARRRFDGELPEDGEGEGAGLAAFSIPAALVRRVSAVAGGDADMGEGAGRGATSTAPLMTVATGLLVRRALEATQTRVVAWQWDYRPEEERRAYEEHLDLHEVIELGAQPGEFDGYFPGDHRGCRCVLRPITASGALGEGVEFG